MERLRDAAQRNEAAVCQALGRALGYPLDPGPNQTGTVCVGEHDAVSLAAEAARVIWKRAGYIRTLRGALVGVRVRSGCWCNLRVAGHSHWCISASKAMEETAND